ncbi:class I SAM-dependent methyltransferase [Biformimicrobium ophioploci]|nr:class I SAM-dependent methyltransferase [Microbulbifer sp. NKW57]
MTDSENQWTEYWSNEGAGGEVFVNRQGEKHPKLREYWQEALSGLPEGTRILDLACGAGSIYRDIASASSGYRLAAADLSEKATQQLKDQMPAVETIVCSADDVPEASGAFDMVVSQFGVEYAGHAGLQEAMRLVAASGQLRLLCHIEDGFIDDRNQRELAGLKLIRDTGFIDHAISVTSETASRNEASAKAAVEAFTSIEPEVAAFVAKNPHGFHSHLYQGFRTMFCNRQRYRTSDIVGWLEAMREEQAKAETRIGEIRGATLSKDDIDQLRARLEAENFRDISIREFTLPEYTQPVAWAIHATRP